MHFYLTFCHLLKKDFTKLCTKSLVLIFGINKLYENIVISVNNNLAFTVLFIRDKTSADFFVTA